MEIIKKLKIKERKNKLNLKIKKKEIITIQTYKADELYEGIVKKNRKSNLDIEMGTRKNKIIIKIPKRRDIIKELK